MCITSKKTKLKFRTRHAKMAASENSRRLLGARAGDARRSLAARRNRMWAPEVCLWLAAMLAGCCALQEQKFAMEPQDQTAILGSRVTLPCRVERKAGALQWTKDDFGLGTHRNLSGYDRYSMVGSDEEGDYSLDIRDVTLEDDASYQCQVSSGPNGEPAIRSRYAQLSVLVAPEPPRIIQGAFIDATEGHPVDIECVSVGGKPAAEITWVDGHQAVIRDGVETKVELMPDGQRFTTRSTLRLTPSMEHHNLTVTCQAQNTADRAYRMAFVHVEVKYAPKLTMSLSSPAVNNMIREGSEARIRCAVAANPPAHSYTWYLDDHPLVGDYTDELIIFNVTKKLNNAEVKCEVGNSVGRSEQSMRLQVTYPPSFRSKPVDVEADPDSWVTLQCDVDAAPAPAVRWLLHEPGRVGQVKGKSATLKLQVSNKTAGRYICKAAVEGYPEIEAEASVLVKGPPSILSNRTQLAEEGETARVECLYLSVPKPDDVSWYFEGREINFIQNPDYTSVDTILDGGLTRAALVIRSSGAQHYGVYNCSVTNEYGNANAAITLKPLKSLPLFIILIGVSSGIIIFALFTTMVAVCHRRRRQAAPGLSKKPDVTVTGTDLFKDSDRSSNISDLKPQLNGDGGYELEYTSSEQSHKMSGGLPLAGPVPVSPRHDDPLLQFRYSNDYTDPQYTDTYYKHGSLGDYLYDYQGYPPPPTLRVQSPPLAEQQTRSQQGSLTRSIDTASTLPLSGGSQSSSLQRGKPDETDAINSLGLPLAGDTPPTPIYAQPQSKHPAHGHGAPPALALGGGVDVRYSAAYGNPYLRNSSLGYGAQAGGKAGAPAPPPYSAVRSSVIIPQGNGTQLSHV